MTEESDSPRGPSGSVGTRWPEIALAGLLLTVSLFVIADSLRVGTGWAEDGPRSGYFPFYIGLMLLGAAGWILGSVFLRWRQADPVFAERAQLAGVVAVLVPMIVYVVCIIFAGIYVSSMLLIGYFMRRHGKFGWVRTLAVALGVPVACFLIFERWFLVPLPKGPLENLLGF